MTYSVTLLIFIGLEHVRRSSKESKGGSRQIINLIQIIKTGQPPRALDELMWRTKRLGAKIYSLS